LCKPYTIITLAPNQYYLYDKIDNYYLILYITHIAKLNDDEHEGLRYRMLFIR